MARQTLMKQHKVRICKVSHDWTIRGRTTTGDDIALLILILLFSKKKNIYIITIVMLYIEQVAVDTYFVLHESPMARWERNKPVWLVNTGIWRLTPILSSFSPVHIFFSIHLFACLFFFFTKLIVLACINYLW